ncbi:MAG: DUF2339 domain-containing protein [Flavobacterium sp.]|nr:DUF2339 domain-containing protein [Flavobacterium sp.]
MEVFLVIFLFAFLLFVRSEIVSKFNALDDKLSSMNKLLIELRKQQLPTESPFGKSDYKPAQVVPEEKPATPITVPIPEIKPIPVIEKEVEKTTTPINFENRQPVYEKTVFSTPSPTPKPAATSYIQQKSWWESFKEKNPDLEKFVGENLINKIGVLILVLGISYFVKYAIDKDWINEPARVGIGILCGALVMAFAHKLRKNYAAFSSVLVAGAIAIFYFTIAIAFHDYHLFGQTAAFIIMVGITAFSAIISLSYNRMELAILSLIGGFAVPFMVSTGAGNYVVLLTYISILDVGILALAFHKKWSAVNVIAYVFTVVLYGVWLVQDNGLPHPHSVGALVFGFVFYFIFVLTNIINNIRTKGVFTTIELSVLASNTFLFYAAGMFILNTYHPELRGLFTTILGLLNLIYAWVLYKKFGLDKTAVYLLIGLTLTFITLAVPIQFEGNYITLFWGAEAVLLMWLSQKSGIKSYRIGSVIVHFLMLISLLMDWSNMYLGTATLSIMANPAFITGAFSVLTFFAVIYLLKREVITPSEKQFLDLVNYRKYLAIMAVITCYFVGFFEITYQSDSYVSGAYSAGVFPFFYHLLFTSGFLFWLHKSKITAAYQLGALIAVINIVLFAFWFSNYPFYEHTENITNNSGQRIAFYLHYFSLAIILFYVWQLFRMQKEFSITNFFQNKIFLWISCFFIVYLASTELMLHALVFSNDVITLADIKNNVQFSTIYAQGDKTYAFSFAADQSIYTVRNLVIRTGFPILWGSLAFVFLIVGIKKQNKSLRIIALSLLGITIAKLFLFDIRNASETGKIIAFILLGVLILIISFVYQKIKVLVLTDNKPTAIEKDETQ